MTPMSWCFGRESSRLCSSMVHNRSWDVWKGSLLPQASNGASKSHTESIIWSELDDLEYQSHHQMDSRPTQNIQHFATGDGGGGWMKLFLQFVMFVVGWCRSRCCDRCNTIICRQNNGVIYTLQHGGFGEEIICYLLLIMHKFFVYPCLRINFYSATHHVTSVKD